MERSGAARRCSRGGDRIQAARPTRARVTTALGALATAGTLAIYPPLVAERVPELVAVPGVIAGGLLFVALVAEFTAAIAWALVLLATSYAVAVAAADGAGVAAAAPLYAAGLLLAAELAYWSIELRTAPREEVRLVLRRLAALVALVGLSASVGACILLVSVFTAGGGLAWDALGVTAFVAVLTVIARLARR